MLVDIIKVIAGLVALVLAADRLVRSAVRISRAFGVSAVLIGAVVVGFGTSIPEFVVSALASIEGNLDLAVSNIVSSNTANVTLVLGAAALIAPLAARRHVIRREGVLMLVSVAILGWMIAGITVDFEGGSIVTMEASGASLSIVEGIILLSFLAAAIRLMVRWSADDPDAVLAQVGEIDGEPVPDDAEVDLAAWRSTVGKEILIGIGSLVVTIVAADLLLDGVVGVGTRFGLSAVVLGLITGVGTSLPELAAGIAAARHHEPDLALGNVLGSNVFNSLGVIGLAAVLGPGHLNEVTLPIIGIMAASALVAGVFSTTGQRINRFEGALLLVGFFAYAAYAFT